MKLRFVFVLFCLFVCLFVIYLFFLILTLTWSVDLLYRSIYL